MTRPLLEAALIDHFSISTIESDDGVTITVAGEIDLLTSGDLETMLAAAIDGRRSVTVDAEGVTFADCAALGVLVKAHIALTCHGQRLVLAAPSRQLLRLLELSRTAAFLLVDPPGAAPMSLGLGTDEDPAGVGGRAAG